jgi:hypothetical protein
VTPFSYEKLLYIHRENNWKTKLPKTTFLRQETACIPHVWTLETNFFTKLTACRMVVSVECSQYLSNSATSIMDLENFAVLNLRLPVEYTQYKIKPNNRPHK